MQVKYLGSKKCFKTSTNTGIFYEFIDNVCDVENQEDIEFFSEHKQYEVEKKKSKKGSDE
jgi:hypothetical protein